MSGEYWIKGSDAHLLLGCAVRWRAQQDSARRRKEVSGSAATPVKAALGVSVHRALEDWFREGSWQSADSARLDDLFCRDLRDHEIPLTGGAVKILREQLRRRSSQLRDWVRQSADAEVRPEASLTDAAMRAKGRADLLVRERTHMRLLDVKTGNPDPSQVRVQLAVYARILGPQAFRGAAVFSPRRGIEELPLAWSEVEELWELLDHRRSQAQDDAIEATPAAANCTYCPLRSACDDQAQSS